MIKLTKISAAVALVAVSASASAWWGGPYGDPYGYGPSGSDAPYGYNAPYGPRGFGYRPEPPAAPEMPEDIKKLVEEREKEIEDQRKAMMEQMQNRPTPPAPPTFEPPAPPTFEGRPGPAPFDRDAALKYMEERIKEMDEHRNAMQQRLDALRESRKKDDCKEAPVTEDTAAEEAGN